MTGFFTNLVHRTLGTVQAVQPTIAPRFAQAPIGSTEIPSADPIEDLDQQSSEIRNKNDKPKQQKPEIESVQTNHMDSAHIQEQQRQTESRQSQPVDPYPEQQERHRDSNEGNSNIVKPIKVETRSPSDLVKPIVNAKNDIEPPNVPDETEIQIVRSEHTNLPGQPGLEHERFTGRELLADTPLVPISHHQPQSIGNSDIPLKDPDYPIGVNMVSGIDGRESAGRTKQQGRAESQTINVTIGRIDVRAVYPPPAQIKRGKTKTNPALSLEDYLQQRQRGER